MCSPQKCVLNDLRFREGPHGEDADQLMAFLLNLPLGLKKMFILVWGVKILYIVIHCHVKVVRLFKFLNLMFMI